VQLRRRINDDKNINPVLSKTGFCYFSVFTNAYLIENIGAYNTADNICQSIHDISGSVWDKRLVNFIADAVKRWKKHAERKNEFQMMFDPGGFEGP